MTYIPQNRLQTNQYTSGGEYQLSSNGNPYVGYYWKEYTGKFFTGKTPTDVPTQQLTLSSPSNDVYLNPPKSTYSSLYFDLDGEGEYSYPNIIDYLSLKNLTQNSQTKLLPTQHYITPTSQDYTIGNFKRYFVIKTNELSYLEIDKKTYDKLISGNSNWAYELYLPFSIIWELKGTEEQVGKTNENIVTLTEQRLRKRGLKEFLRRNYTKFWLPQ